VSERFTTTFSFYFLIPIRFSFGLDHFFFFGRYAKIKGISYGRNHCQYGVVKHESAMYRWSPKEDGSTITFIGHAASELNQALS
jgi:hypothetical protein